MALDFNTLIEGNDALRGILNGSGTPAEIRARFVEALTAGLQQPEIHGYIEAAIAERQKTASLQLISEAGNRLVDAVENGRMTPEDVKKISESLTPFDPPEPEPVPEPEPPAPEEPE